MSSCQPELHGQQVDTVRLLVRYNQLFSQSQRDLDLVLLLELELERLVEGEEEEDEDELLELYRLTSVE